MVTLSENNNNSEPCSSTTPQIGNDREHFGSNIVSSTNSEREFTAAAAAASAGSAAAAAAAAAAAVAAGQNQHQNPHGLWDLTNPEIGYELAASSGN